MNPIWAGLAGKSWRLENFEASGIVLKAEEIWKIYEVFERGLVRKKELLFFQGGTWFFQAEHVGTNMALSTN